MPLFSRDRPKSKPVEQAAEPRSLDPIALCLAIWLGMMVCAFGLVRLSNEAARRAEQPHRPVPATTVNPLGLGR